MRNDKDSRHAIQHILPEKIILSMILMSKRHFVSQVAV